MKNRRILTIALFLLGLILLLLLGLALDEWLVGVLIGIVFAIVGIVFYRRGK